MKHINTQHYAILALSFTAGCGGKLEELATIADGETIICYRGQRVSAAEMGGTFVIEGDILVHESDLWCESDSDKEGVIRERARIQGSSFRWPRGVVPYEFGSDSDATDQNGDDVIDAADRAPSFTTAQRQTIIDAMDEWAANVPGLTFRPAISSDTNRLRFEPDFNKCSSFIGRVGSSAQRINVPGWCMESKSIHHEVAHALGFYHHHTRKDRDAFVTINWSNIKGCQSVAASPSDCGPTACSGDLADCGCTATDVANSTCYMAGNFTTNNSRANILDYDYTSVMHYNQWGFSKGGATISPPTGQTIGQRSMLSNLDVASMRAAYPRAQVPSSVVYSHGHPVQLCELVGREQDAATKFRVGSPGNNGSFGFSNNVETFSSYSGVRVLERQCDVRSNFWVGNYNYPNLNSGEYGGATFDESFSDSGTVVALHVAFVPVLL